MATTAVRELLKRSGLLVKIVHGWRHGMRANDDIVKELVAFSPNSAGSFQDLAPLALQSAQQTFPLICLLARKASRPLIEPQPIESLFPQASDSLMAELAALFDKYGSDKSVHDYHLVYAPLLGSKRDSSLRLLEIGLGTNNSDVVSNMGPSGRPGASLRAFRDFCPNAQVFGADVDKNILFNEDRIRTYYVDQTKLSSFDELHARLADGTFDLVIDDGLHSPDANIATLLFALKVLSPSGFLIIEDIHPSSVPIWQVVAAILPDNHSPKLVRAKHGLLFMIQKAA